MMKRAVLGVALLNFALLLGCTRVQVEILQPAGETQERTPDPGKKIKNGEIPAQEPVRERGPGAALQSNFIVLTQTPSGNSCAADRSVTRPVAQETDVWCWAASVEGVTSFHKVDLPQCVAVNKVKAEDGKTGGDPFCCKNMLDGACQQNGWPDEVFDSFGIDYRWLSGILSQQNVARQICGNGPFIYSIAFEGGGGHTFVAKDYSASMDGKKMWLFVDNHGSYKDDNGNLRPVGFRRLPYRAYAEGWYGGTQTPHEVNFTWVRIIPQD